MTTNDTPLPLEVPPFVPPAAHPAGDNALDLLDETPLEAVRRVLANADHLDEDSITQTLFLFNNHKIFRDLLRHTTATLQKALDSNHTEVVEAVHFLRSF